MPELTELSEFLEQTLKPADYRDYCPNGVQISGVNDIQRIVTGVSANQALIDAAVEEQADALLVHHGFFWKGEDARIIGIKRKRIATLLEHGINLIAYHLPLDGHPELGNNVQLGQVLGIEIEDDIPMDNGPGLLYVGYLKKPMSGEQFSRRIAKRLGRKPLYIEGASEQVESIAWCTGAAQDFLEYASFLQVDTYITGEVSERTVAQAREIGIHFYAAGHHATERYGIQALGNHLVEELGIQHTFIDIDNPV